MKSRNGVILEGRGIRKHYLLGRARQEVLRGVDVRVCRGEFVAITGSSGSGKSTLLHILGLLDEASGGEVFFDGQNMYTIRERGRDRVRNRAMGFVFQFYHLLPELNVQENILLPMMVDRSVWRWFSGRAGARKRAEELIEAFGLEGQARQRPVTLSGGERQRVAIARALVQRPELLLADEPTGNLDSHTGERILGHLKELNRQGQTIVMVTHDDRIACQADRELSLRDGKILVD